jgi:hypothetical protein
MTVINSDELIFLLEKLYHPPGVHFKTMNSTILFIVIIISLLLLVNADNPTAVVEPYQGII